LEFIDDQILFPYGQPAILTARPPHLDTNIPSTAFSRMSLANVMGRQGDDGDSIIYSMDEESSDTDTISHVPMDGVWDDQAAGARELEDLFESMINVKFGIHLRPSEFVLEKIVRAFGGVKEVTAMHLTLAPVADEHDADDALANSPGLILWPSTFIPMTPEELEIHASKHQRVLLSCKAGLIDYAAEIAEIGEGRTQSDAAKEALWDYQK
ncbi:unnamed protein product, partial [Mycena citricolor]